MLIRQYHQLRKNNPPRCKSALPKPNALKRAADEEEEQLDNALSRRKAFVVKNQGL